MTWTLRWGRVSHCRTYGTPVKTATGKGTCYAGKCSILQNDAGTHVSDGLFLTRGSGAFNYYGKLSGPIRHRSTVLRYVLPWQCDLFNITGMRK